MRFILTAYNIQELGKRANQEDSLYPALGQQTDNDRLFILCDGMGGHAKGEVASSTVCTAMSNSIMQMCPDPEGAFTDEILLQAINDAFDALDAADPENAVLKKMGTTMTFLKLHENGATIAHMGDSRVYHVRPGQNPEDTQIMFVTEDHSLVNDLVKIGELTPEEAKTSRQKNVITRAMQPHMERRPRADIYHTVDIQPGDYFFMCSDGILERWEDYDVQRCFSHSYGDDEARIRGIIQETIDNSDNHTAIIVKILDVQGTAQLPVNNNNAPWQQPNMYGNQMNYGTNTAPGYQGARQQTPNEVTAIPAAYGNTMGGDNYQQQRVKAAPVKKENITWFWLMLAAIAILFAVFVIMLLR